VREMKEELGLNVRPIKQVWKHEFSDKPLTLWGWLAELENGSQMSINEDEIAEIFWMNPVEGSSHPDGMATNRDFIACLQEQR